MHLLIIAPEQIPVPPIRGGSVEICIYAIARQLAKKHQVTVISRQHRSYSRMTKRGQLQIIRVRADGKAGYLREVIRAMKGLTFDWVQVDNRPNYAAAIKRHFPQTPVSLFLHSLTFVKPPYTTAAKCAAQLRSVDWIVANSASLEQELIKRFPKSRNQMHKVYLGTDIKRFRPRSRTEQQRLRAKYRITRGFHVLFAGRLIRRKGIRQLIEAVHTARREVPDMKLLIAGGEQSKGYKASLRSRARRLAVPVKFLGNVPHRNIHEVYGLADCFVCPSQRHEAFGLVNVEAMASGLPVIASAIGGVKEIVKDGHNGVLIRAYRSPKAIARGIVAVAKRREWASGLAKQARSDAVSQFSWQATAQSLADFYRLKLEAKYE
ncbi:glycosyltransferase family 4 protein [Paenibacillus sp. GCM10023248]|uniref:glycosyltransferase family 4 protein n=1 Tax=unclassified Paenibacillus TaxID=185978 RepID=UPI0023789DC8|nr:glycosyltransferase family 4 protein [Paenibacillus sp. MAHUQ-63]MDD9271176.1 glycosyltransferase family 4 protein [Paenibacillus sp. MAHUQ-63]